MKKQIVFALFVCAGLGVFYFATREREVRVGIKALDLPQIDSESVSKIRYEGKQSFSLKKNGEDFVLELKENGNTRDVAASKEAIKELFEAISHVKGGVFVTEQVDKHAQFKVNEDQGQKVTLLAKEKPVWELIIGDYADEGGRYVRVPSQNAVFLVKARFWDITRSDVADFRERKIVGINEDSIQSLRIEKGSDQLVGFERDDKRNWEFDAKSKALFPAIQLSSERATNFVKTVTGLRAASFVEKPEILQKAQQLINTSSERIVIAPISGSELTVAIANDEKEKKAYAQVKGSGSVFEISDYVYGLLHPKADDFKEVAAAEKKDIKSLPPEIQKQLQEAMGRGGK